MLGVDCCGVGWPETWAGLKIERSWGRGWMWAVRDKGKHVSRAAVKRGCKRRRAEVVMRGSTRQVGISFDLVGLVAQSWTVG